MRVPLDTACSICGVQPGTVYRWVHDGTIRSFPSDDGTPGRWYDVYELLHWIDTRNPDGVALQAGVSGEAATRMARAAVAARREPCKVQQGDDSA